MSTVPDVIGAADIAEQKHVKRLYEQEPDDYTIMFQNRDLSKTTYIFSVPVKNQSALGTNEIMTVTSSAGSTAIVLNNAALMARLGNADIPGGLMPYNIGMCKIKSVSSGGVVTQSSGTAASGVDVVDQIRDIATERSAEQNGIVALSANITLDISDTSMLSGSEITYMVLNTSDIAGDYALKAGGTSSRFLKNNSGSLITALGSTLPESRWLIEAGGGDKFLIRSQSAQTSYIMERSSGPEILYYEYSLGHQWTISYEETVNGTEFWSIVSSSGEYLASSNGNVILSEVADDVPSSALWGFMNKITCIDVQKISVADHVNVLVGDELDIEELVTYIPSNATYKGVVVGDVNSSMLEENVLYDVLSVGVNKISITYAYETYDIGSWYCAVISSTSASEIRSSYTHMLRTDTTDPADALLLTLNASRSNISSTSLSLSTLNDTWEYISQAFIFTELSDGSYRISAALSTAQYEAPAYNGTGTMQGAYHLADEDTKNNTLTLSGQSLALTSYSANDKNQRWYVVRNGDRYSFINAAKPQYALSYSSSTVGVGTYSAASSGFKWNTTYLGINVPVIKQSTNYYCGVASTLQILYAIDPDAVAELTTSSDLKDQMNALAPTLGTTAANGASRYLMWYNVLEKYGYRVLYNRTFEAINSINRGYPCIAHIIDAKRFPRYVSKGYAIGTGHYITVIGYDSVSDMLVFSDCSYLINPNTRNTNFGIYLVACDDLDQLALESTDVINIYVAAP